MFNAIVGNYATLRRLLSLQPRRFRNDEDGAMIVFGLIFFVLMLMIGGLAVDFMRFEYTRTRLQNTLDRATLAAASLDQQLDPTLVVKDYLLKANMADQLASVRVTQGLSERIVHATGVADTHPIFMHMMGINRWDAVGASEAQQAIDNLEIVLVLDVSGSMAGQKIANLKIAADEFVDTMMANDPRHRVSIAIVPYNAQVNIGPLLAAKFNLTNRANVPNVNCVEIPATEYATQALSLTNPMPMMAYADIASATSKVNAYVAPTDASYAMPSLVATGVFKGNIQSAFCPPTTTNVVRLPSNDPAVLKSEIDAMLAGGNTSITLGMKWGAAMLDPSMRATYASFIATGDMPASLPDRPFNYDDKDAKKYIILMTDGEHVAHNRINDAFKTGPSPIWKAPDGRYSVQVVMGRPAWAGANTWYVPHLGTYQAAAYAGGGTAVRQDWSAIWANLKMNYVAWQFYARPLGASATSASASVFNTTVAAMQSIYAGNTDAAVVANMDASLQTTCDQVRANKVIVYGITVEAPQHGIDVISKCAPDHNFAADRTTIRSTFQKIAANITNLKLTQ
jgi:Flp pilus assembly protein TadG